MTKRKKFILEAQIEIIAETADEAWAKLAESIDEEKLEPDGSYFGSALIETRDL